ncbi:MAG: AAA family ATPase [Treponema sp.]|nr:AAA family ATPase [Treponema sp.]
MADRFLPIGIQDFEKLRNFNNIYVDKTPYIYELARTSTPYFLSRPNRGQKRHVRKRLLTAICRQREAHVQSGTRFFQRRKRTFGLEGKSGVGTVISSFPTVTVVISDRAFCTYLYE